MNFNYAIVLDDISYSFRGNNVLNSLNLQIPQGSIYGILGLNGVGKTTLIKLLTGLYLPTSGTITVFGIPINSQNISVLKEYTGSLIEEASLYDHLTAIQNLKIVSQMYGLDYDNIYALLKVVDLYEARQKKVKTYSLGMRQRLGIAMALVSNPKLLILDEPMNGLDPLGIVEFRNFLKKLSIELGLTVIFSSHNLHEVELMATHIAILSNKNIVFESTLPIKNIHNPLILLKVDTEYSTQARKALNDNNFKIIKESLGEFEIECGLNTTIRDVVLKTDPIKWNYISLKKINIEELFLENI